MVKEITKIAKVEVDSLEVASGISIQISEQIVNEAKNYIAKRYKILEKKDIDKILDDDEWWGSLLENLIDNM